MSEPEAKLQRVKRRLAVIEEKIDKCLVVLEDNTRRPDKGVKIE